jgi:DNA-binding XRE family transcriptional regulator
MKQQTTQEFSPSAARVNAGHTVRSLANVLGIDWRTYARLEEGKAIHPAKALKVADFFGVRVTDIPGQHSKAAA